MKEMAITVTEASRNFADCVSRAHYQHMKFVLLKNGKPFARIEPEGEKRCTGRELAEALADVELTPEEARVWHSELQTARAALQAPTNKW